MKRQRKFPPEGWTTRRVFIGSIAALALAILLASVFGPVLLVSDADPRPWAAVISVVTYLVMIAMIAWLAWMVLRPRRRDQGPPDR